MKRFRALLVVAAAGILTGTGAPSWAASSALLSALDAGSGSISAGNATYSNFTYVGDPLDTTVLATASVDGSGNSLITFTRTSGTWTELDGHSVITFHADFIVPVASTQLDFVASATGSVIASVGETFTDGTTQSPQVYTGFLGSQFSSSYTFNSPVTSFDTLKSIDITPLNNFAPGLSGSGTITSVDNVFVSGVGNGVPEPASLGVLGIGALGLMLRRRSR